MINLLTRNGSNFKKNISRTKQTGYPVINVSSYVNENNETVLKLDQARFFSNGSKPTPEEDFLWKVPISIVTKSSYPEVHKSVLLEKRSDEVNLGVLPQNDWIKLNKNSIGLYRTNYTPELLNRCVDLIKEQQLHPTDRLGLQSDVFALSESGHLATSEVLRFIESFSAETNVVVWKDLISNLLKLSHTLLNTNFQADFQAFIVRLLTPISQKLGWNPIPGESKLQKVNDFKKNC